MSNIIIRGSGVLIVAKKTQRILLLLRAGSSFENCWGLPGGKLEPNETLLMSARRECLEETKYSLDIHNMLPIDFFVSYDGKFEFATYLYIIEDEFIPELNHESKGFMWVNLGTIPKDIHPYSFKFLKSKTTIENITQKVKDA